MKKPKPTTIVDTVSGSLLPKDRKRMREELREEMRHLAKYKKKQRERIAETDWPIDAATGERADVDPDDVRAPLPDDLQSPIGIVDEKMQKLRAEADELKSFDSDVVQVDPGVLARRRAEREQERIDRESIRGDEWTAEIVEARIEHAFRTLLRMSVGSIGPREFGNAMPKVVREMSDIVHQAGNKSLRNAILHRFKANPSSDDVRLADEALAWAMEYLGNDDPDYAGFVQLGALWKVWGSKISKRCREIGVNRQTFYRDRKIAIRLIVEGLKRDGRAPT